MAPKTHDEQSPSAPAEKETLLREFLRRFQGYWVEGYNSFDLKNPDNCWFWGLFIYTHLYVFCLWVEWASRPLCWLLHFFTDIQYADGMFSPNPMMYRMYLVLLGGFVLFNKTLRLIVGGKEVLRPGNYMFIMWIGTGAFFFMTNSITRGYLVVPHDIFNLMWQIAGIFGLGEVADKGIEKMVEKRVRQALAAGTTHEPTK